MRRLFAIFVFLTGLTACSSIPFQKTADVPLDAADPWMLAEQFSDKSPERFQIMNTIMFEYNWNKFSGIGYIYVDSGEEIFKAVCINPMGVKLFELTGDKNNTTPHFVLDQLSKKGDFAKTVGEDIRRIYFDLTPSAAAQIKKRRYQLIFKEPAGAGIMEYVFAGTGGYLVEKNYYEENKLDWGISYYEYQQKGGSIYPGGIILNNYKYGYSLTVKLKEIQN